MNKIPINKVNLDETLQLINNVNQKCLKYIYESDLQKNDARRMIFVLLSIHIQNLLLSTSLSKKLKSPEFYSENGFKTNNINDEYMENALYQFISGFSNSYFLLIYVQIENYLRIIASHEKIENYKISTTIQNLINHFQIDEDIKNLWDIFSNMRNSMHSGGFFNYSTKSISYKEKEYFFEKNSPILYGGIDNYLFFTNELIDNLIKGINDKSKDVTYIEHNYAKLTFE